MVAHEKIETPTDRLHRVFDVQVANHAVPSATARLSKLSKLKKAIEENEAQLIAAIHADFGNRADHETRLAEVVPSYMAIKHAKSNLLKWMGPRSVATDPMFLPGKSRIVPQPLGVVGIIAPWNYPLLLIIGPLVAAIAAGNRAIIKPSEFTPTFSAAFERVIAETFEPSDIAVVRGGAEVAEALTRLKLDHLLFTGSTRVGREVAKAAAENMTPVTLELGGKSPVIIDKTEDLDIALQRIVRGKMFNAGQTCIAPDYMLVPEEMLDEVQHAAIAIARKMYPHVASNGELTAIINESHFKRLNSLITDAISKGATAVHHAEASVTDRRLPLTLLTDVTDDMHVMQEEIFGPVLPIVPYQTLDDALAYIRARPHPLALYWFGEHKGHEARVVRSAMAGGITINDTLLHVTQENLPFGGVGQSGMGAYHGRTGFDTMSHLKSVFIQSRWTGADLLTPPLSKTAHKIIALAQKWAR